MLTQTLTEEQIKFNALFKIHAQKKKLEKSDVISIIGNDPAAYKRYGEYYKERLIKLQSIKKGRQEIKQKDETISQLEQGIAQKQEFLTQQSELLAMCNANLAKREDELSNLYKQREQSEKNITGIKAEITNLYKQTSQNEQAIASSRNTAVSEVISASKRTNKYQ